MKALQKEIQTGNIPLDQIEVVKANGELVPFVPEKVMRSLINSGADESQAREILNAIITELEPGISTKQIYKKAFHLLKKNSAHLAARYNLKNAIMQLGPSGYPFEKYIGEILRFQGYSTEVGQIVEGHCVNHEIDVIAEKDNHHFMIECKYHNTQGINSDVKIPLYIYSRFKDVEEQWLKLPGHGRKFHQGWVVTNTRFSQDAIQFGTCRGMKLISWDYPAKESLKEMIDRLGLYPITCLTSLTQLEKRSLLDNKVVLCSELCQDNKLLENLGLKSSRIKAVMNEGMQLCKRIIHQGKHKQV